MTNIILASHGELAKGMKHSVNMIVGDLCSDIEVFCLYPGMNPEDFANEMRSRIEADDANYIFVCDILGGSVHTALSQLLTNDRVSIFSGMNMNLVLSLVLANQNGIDQNAMNQILSEAQTGITFKTCIEEEEDEDF